MEEKGSDVRWPDGRKDIWRNEEVDRTDWYEDKASDLQNSRIYRLSDIRYQMIIRLE